MKIRTWPLTLSLFKEHRFLCGILCWSFLALPLAAQMGGMGMGRRGMGGGNFASTAQQGASYGMASMMRAQGYQNLQNSEAAKNLQTAQSQQIDNRKKWTDTYFDMRKTNRKARADPERRMHRWPAHQCGPGIHMGNPRLAPGFPTSDESPTPALLARVPGKWASEYSPIQ